ncbi:ABC transporter permease [Butyrivibrio sp. YAB3001]|uniref:ABC transporter permease n=1 Tax=Butyrivibrio sp. YAB3001 TaxID=1520812 RepID=UPI0008F6656E|nr:ABC transporter permease [Butyrivibrio sp. YAB3001]SFC36918.1 MacB-like core domain-containing protein [Butyrivibrio sp. YAB3001]
MIFEKICNCIKSFFSNKKRNVILIIIAALLLVDLILGLICRLFVSKLPEQLAADRWNYEGNDAQVSIFFTEDQMITPDDIKKLEYTMETKLRDAGVLNKDDDEEENAGKIVDTIELGGNEQKTEASDKEKVNEIALLYNSCYSAQGFTSIVFEDRTASDVDAIGVEGDFFFFHPLTLVNGAYFSPDDIMKDRIVVDEELAWQLFGSSDIIGQCVEIGGVNHYIAGVVKRDEGRINKAAGLNKSVVFMSYESLSQYGTILSGRTDSSGSSEDGTSSSNGGINCYEAVIPNPVDGSAAKMVKESSGIEDKYISVVDNTNRFTFFNILEIIGSFGKRSMWDKPIFYPYWENVARGWEDIIALIWFFKCLFRVSAALLVTIFIVDAYRKKTWRVSQIVAYLADKKYEYEARKQIQGR